MHIPSSLVLRHTLKRQWHLSTDNQREAGANWYPIARRIVGRWSIQYGYSPETVAVIIAALSPQCDWHQNLVGAESILVGGIATGTRCLQACIRKAVYLRESNACLDDLIDVMPHGAKVNHFAANLCGLDHCVTIDTHAMQAALDNPIAVVPSTAFHWNQYRTFESAYVDTATDLGIVPTAFQATLWLSWKDRYSPEHKRSLINRSKQS